MALRSVLEHLAERGRVTLLVYRGHEGGIPEYQEVRQFLEQLPGDQWLVEELASTSDSPIAPRLFRIRKILKLFEALSKKDELVHCNFFREGRHQLLEAQ